MIENRDIAEEDHDAFYVMKQAQKLADETGASWYVIADDDGHCAIANKPPPDVADDLFVIVVFPR